MVTACAALLACAAISAAPTTAPKAAPTGLPAGNSKQPINLEAASSDFDYKNNSLLFRRVKITQGQLQVMALEASASGLNFENSEWLLKGQVQILVPDGKLESSTAQVAFRSNEIVRAVIKGDPATFEQKLKDKGQLARGRASTIEYDVQASTVRLSGEAWLTDGQNEIRGNTLIYDIGKQRVVANPNEKDPGGVHITINPKNPMPAPAPVPRKEPAP
jgi:lipopolysaccharide export system protein LptA